MYVAGWRKIEGSFQGRNAGVCLGEGTQPRLLVALAYTVYCAYEEVSGLVYEMFLAMLMLKLWKSLCRMP